jgi:hypothetical protein
MRPLRDGFGRQPVGHNKLDSIISQMMEEAQVLGFFTLHSLRATAATRLYESGYQEQTIMEVTGHQSSAVREYKRTSDGLQARVSECLQSTAGGMSAEVNKTAQREVVPVCPSGHQIAAIPGMSVELSKSGHAEFLPVCPSGDVVSPQSSSTPKRLQLDCGDLRLSLHF